MIVRIQIKAKVVFDAPETEDNIEFQNELNIMKVRSISGFVPRKFVKLKTKKILIKYSSI